jgi:hypothetical protein
MAFFISGQVILDRLSFGPLKKAIRVLRRRANGYKIYAGYQN